LKEATVQDAAAGSANVNSRLNDARPRSALAYCLALFPWSYHDENYR